MIVFLTTFQAATAQKIEILVSSLAAWHRKTRIFSTEKLQAERL